MAGYNLSDREGGFLEEGRREERKVKNRREVK